MAEKRLTKEIAEQFLADDTSIDLREFTVIDDEAAEILWVYEGQRLHLDGLTALSDVASQHLKDFSGSLSLQGLVTGIVQRVLNAPIDERETESGVRTSTHSARSWSFCSAARRMLTISPIPSGVT